MHTVPDIAPKKKTLQFAGTPTWLSLEERQRLRAEIQSAVISVRESILLHCAFPYPGTSLRLCKAEKMSDGVRVRFRVRFQAVKVPIFGGFPVENPTNKANRLKALLRGISLSEYSSEGFRVVEEVVRVWFCCLLS